MVNYCPICGEPTSKEIEFRGHTFYFGHLLCSCSRKEDEAFDAETKYIKDQDRIEIGYLSRSYTELTWDKDDRPESEASQFLNEYCDHWKQMLEGNDGLILVGNVGSGKTFYASCVANTVRKSGYNVLIGTMPEFLDEMSRDFERNKSLYEEKIDKFPLMVIDDFGTERLTERYKKLTYEIINRRYIAKKPLIITTNLTSADIERIMKTDLSSEQIWSRIKEMCGTRLVITGGDRRPEIGKQKARYAQAVLAMN